ncbi:SAM-dependent methyltransferase [Actinomadura rubrisoli]|uniref:SAM-dependent methyltransferase n=1 Tax=Actinomadura rubrisoli TaxID=2530368 RepID=A0A4R5B2I1_9ACTN|nr:SAM-dependent methyltransferase [Actinomadura rubrisoli]TDD79203.1 SAM-dependent methyltransferase [Actinomadura rubrisoli]
MSDRPSASGAGLPEEIDTSVAHSARVWNHWLGGKDCFEADRAAGDRVFQMFPDIINVARADRSFLARAVRFLVAEAGIDQFLDIGTGLPTADNTHEVAQRIAPECRVVYVDNDPMVLVHARALLNSTPAGATAYIAADARDSDTILDEAGQVLDFSRPIAVMMLGILNFITDAGEAHQAVSRLVDAVPSGSYLAITHPTQELGGGANAEAMKFWNENVQPPICARNEQEVAGFFAGLRLLEPGIVSCSRWRPEPVLVGVPAPEVAQFGAVGYKP